MNGFERSRFYPEKEAQAHFNEILSEITRLEVAAQLKKSAKMAGESHRLNIQGQWLSRLWLAGCHLFQASFHYLTNLHFGKSNNQDSE
jgi:hypothetical protein